MRFAVRVVDNAHSQLVSVHLFSPSHVRALHVYVIETLDEPAGGEVGYPLLLPAPLLVMQPGVYDLGYLDGVSVGVGKLQQGPLHVGVVHGLHAGPLLGAGKPVEGEVVLQMGVGVEVALDEEGPVADRAPGLPHPLSLGRHL